MSPHLLVLDFESVVNRGQRLHTRKRFRTSGYFRNNFVLYSFASWFHRIAKIDFWSLNKYSDHHGVFPSGLKITNVIVENPTLSVQVMVFDHDFYYGAMPYNVVPSGRARYLVMFFSYRRGWSIHRRDGSLLPPKVDAWKMRSDLSRTVFEV